MRNRLWYFTAILLVVQAGLAFLAWPNMWFNQMKVVSALITFILPLPLYLLIQMHSGRQVFLFGGLSIFLFYFPFLIETTIMKDFFSSFFWFIMALTICIIWFWFGCIAFLLNQLYRSFRWAFPFLIPAAYTSYEFLLTALAPRLWFIPPPEGLIAYPLAGFPPLIQMASFTGLFGPDFMINLFAATLAFILWEGLLRWPRGCQWLGINPDQKPLVLPQLIRSLNLAGALAILMLLLTLIGNIEAVRVGQQQAQSKRFLTPALLQDNFDPASCLPWDIRVQTQFLNLFHKLALSAAQQKADVLVLTEGAIPGTLPQFKKLWDGLRDILKEVQIPALLGMLTTVDEKHTYNTWFLLDAQGGVVDYYIKQYILPFGEYLPLRFIIDPILDGISYLARKTYNLFRLTATPSDNYDLTPGKKDKIFYLNNRRILLKVCGELLFPSYFRAGIKLGAEVVIVPATANWFPTSNGTYRYSLISSYRAVETRRWICRVANMGLAFYIDPLGQIQAITPYQQRAVLTHRVPLLTYRTFYMRYGDIFGWLCLLLTLAFSLLLLRPYWPKFKNVLNRFIPSRH